MKYDLITTLVLVLIFATIGYVSYGEGKMDGCYDLVTRLNSFGYNMADKGVGLSAYAWCRLKNDQRTK